MKSLKSKGFLETEADKIRDHLTPIMTYSKLIHDGKMGQVSEIHRKKIQVIITEAERINDLLKTFNKEDVSESSSIKNKIAELELKLAFSEQKLEDKVQQIKQLLKEERKTIQE